MALTPGTRIGAYEIIGLLGAGGMGEVYRARDARLGRDVAIKILPDAFAQDTDRLARFQREAKTLASLNHPNIAIIHGLEQAGTGHALVMELVEGEDLSQRIANGALPLEEALPIAKQIAGALEAAHEQGIIHRDLKPANIKLKEDGTVKVLDFGLAKAIEPATTAPASVSQSPTITTPAMTQAGMILGTAAYMSPEQAKGRPADKRSDVWAFGAVLYEMLSGRRAFSAEDVAETLAAVLMKEPDWTALPTSVPTAVSTVLRRCLQKDRKQRVRDLGDVSLALDGAFAVDGTRHRGSETEKPITRTQSASWLRRMGWAAVIVFALAALGASIVALRRSGGDPLAAMTLSLLPPDGVGLTALSIPAISPDGRHVAFLGLPAGKRGFAQTAIWIRDLDSLKAWALPGTESAQYPFWSGDSKSLAFFTRQELMRVDLGGGPPTLIAKTKGRAGSWGRDVIVVQAATTGALFGVPVHGGPLTPISALDTTRGEVLHAFPWFLPDGRHFLYTALDAPGKEGTVYLAEVGSNERHAVASSSANAAFALPGFLVYLRGRTLMAQAFDAAKGVTVAAAFPIAEQIDFLSTQAQGRFSVSQTGVLVYAGRNDSGNVQLTWFDRKGATLGLVGEAADGIQFPRISPDGGSILYDRQESRSGVFGIWLHDVARGTDVRLTTATEVGRYPAWQGNTDMVFLTYTPRGIGFKGVRAGSQAKVVEGQIAEYERPLALSSDGRFLFVERNDVKTKADIWIYPLSSGAPKHADATPYLSSASTEQYAAPSPNNRWVAYVSDESGRREVYVQTFPSLSRTWQVSTGGGDYPVWGRDGKELFFIAEDGQMMAATVGLGPAFEASVPKALFDPHIISNGWFDVSKDGRFLVPVQSERVERAPMTVVVNWQEKVARDK